MVVEFGVVDLFAGPGGLAEGFSSVEVNGTRPFKVMLSVEKELAAHSTLRLRAFIRQFAGNVPPEYQAFLSGEPEPDWASLYPEQWCVACSEAVRLELGSEGAEQIIDARLDSIKEQFGSRTVLIGGPPCQAYSLVGRARNVGNARYVASEDARHFLYREYIRILRRLRPAAFIMENVKGMLSANVDGVEIFEQVLRDLREIDGEEVYELIPVAPENLMKPERARPNDFVVRAERFGVPQSRHRVIVMGIRRDCTKAIRRAKLADCGMVETRAPSVGEVLSDLPKVRSGINSRWDSPRLWEDTVRAACASLIEADTNLSPENRRRFRERLRELQGQIDGASAPSARSGSRISASPSCAGELFRWLSKGAPAGIKNHETRCHMVSDLTRYLFASVYSEAAGVSPRSMDFPASVAPAHQNWNTGKFKDRFRVQLLSQPSSTITSHISKDGHYFIHPDPLQCRSLTVREAARLQTFPDDYVFLGTRTQQFVQVGNAVPPFLAFQIARHLLTALQGEFWEEANRETEGKSKLSRRAAAA
ncbi:DNA (cytosine-5-)-methyltransferase [Rhizobium leguminosarum]|uniref:DNA cytosine methyltransferase n=1 Tax=Rhizobium ruizarguesonis TaxID=2081791 RepID=UPI00103E3FD1|nr:DNA cytosine methyltransferase [Rhizobium ruizarguesonis]MBY5807646.1 DNA cytosine methyltransferase [Rhizobium leguminosarum]TCB12997.1 DNA cytosine methyltransferase [Rhizobium leguminosarum bv. viciae]MBY5848220.1 DNA cytosine methyltransferase [Rhizobium leguminosarum]NEH88631.1 DNA (cytosine-5-)-methyltransferase [Rhizobium ruizarguesonis]NEI17594.1 DNA (cytosine-5-)-methyltransferase [Rhizobium ruizarguesonis]